MRDREGKRMMVRMRVRKRGRLRITSLTRERHLTRRREENRIRRMGFVDLNPLGVTIYCLVNSSRTSIDSRSREFLKFAKYGVKEAVELLKSLEVFNDRIGSKKMKGLEAEITEAALKLEDVLDSHVSNLFLSQSEAESGNERCPLLYSLNLQGIEEDVYSFVPKMMEMEKLLNPWSEEEGEGGRGVEISDQSGGSVTRSWFATKAASIFSGMKEKYIKGCGCRGIRKESDNLGISDQSGSRVSRSWFMSWFATKAASVFSGMKEDYIQELDNLLPKEDLYHDGYAVLITGDLSSSDPLMEGLYREIKHVLISWWKNKAASIFVVEEEQLDNPLPEDDDAVSSRTGYDALNMSNMVGSIELFCEIRNDLIEGKGGINSIVGMAGIGKTALAQQILHDPLISNKFGCCIFVRLGLKYQPKEIMQAILAQMPDRDKMQMAEHGDLYQYLLETLRDKKYLIVLDDVWDRDLWKILLSKIYAQNYTESSVLITTRINQVAFSDGRKYQVPFLNKEESWDLLREKIFGEKRCPHELEKDGKTIAENCEGLPLLIVIVAELLSKAEKTPEHWSQVAANKTNSTFVEAYEQTYKVVRPSYDYLPLRLKACFLYLGAFPQNDEVSVSKLLNLWSADGFLGVTYTLLQGYIDGLLREIVSNNVALGTQWSSISDQFIVKLKACSLHSVFWYLCKREAWNEKFLLVLNSCTDARAEGIQSARRLSIYKNSILSIKDVRDSIASMPAVRSLLCTGPYHPYQVPIRFGLRLLKVLDVLTIRFYKFPLDVLKLLQLRYLALTCNGNLPPSISKLWSLRFLIVHQHLIIKSSVSESYLPVEIWELQELEYLQITGRNLPDPPPGAVLKNLLILLDVGSHTCTERVLGSIPSLKKLRVQIELMPVSAEPLSFCDDISLLNELRSLQFVVVNPVLMSATVAPAPLFSFSTFIRKLTLSGLGYPWEYMSSIAELPILAELKLKSYAFQGEKWEVKESEFRKLEYLLIEDTDLVKWTGFLRFLHLTIKHCYKLQEIPNQQSGSSSGYRKEIRLVDCNPSAVTFAKQMATSNYCVYVESSW